MKKSTIIILAISLGSLSTIAAYAHNGATGIVKERMDGMMAMGKVVKSLSLIMRGEQEYDPEAVKAGAKIIDFHAGETMTALFPVGSLQKASVAKVEIWSDWDTFEKLSEQLRTYAKGLEAAAENGLAQSEGSASSMMGTDSSTMMGISTTMMGVDSMPEMPIEQLAGMPADGVFNMVTQTCSVCHTKFRIEKK